MDEGVGDAKSDLLLCPCGGVWCHIGVAIPRVGVCVLPDFVCSFENA